MPGPAPTISQRGAAPDVSPSPPNGVTGGDADHIESAAPPGSVCPYYHEAVEMLGKRWTGAIVLALLPGRLRYSELSQAVPLISDRLLSMRLKELEAGGLVVRSVCEGAPVRVEYELTPMGRALEPAVVSLRQWAREWLRR